MIAGADPSGGSGKPYAFTAALACFFLGAIALYSSGIGLVEPKFHRAAGFALALVVGITASRTRREAKGPVTGPCRHSCVFHVRHHAGFDCRQYLGHRDLHHPDDQEARDLSELRRRNRGHGVVRRQIMPPIMGAAALVMADLTGVVYMNIIVAALFPALECRRCQLTRSPSW